MGDFCPVGECVTSDSLSLIVLTSVPALDCDKSLVVLPTCLPCVVVVLSRCVAWF